MPELQRRLGGTTATANCFHPGTVRTRFGAFGSTDFNLFERVVYKLAAPFSKTPAQGADLLIWLTTSDLRHKTSPSFYPHPPIPTAVETCLLDCILRLLGHLLLTDRLCIPYSTVTLLARFRGLSTSVPRAHAV